MTQQLSEDTACKGFHHRLSCWWCDSQLRFIK